MESVTHEKKLQLVEDIWNGKPCSVEHKKQADTSSNFAQKEPGPSQSEDTGEDDPSCTSPCMRCKKRSSESGWKKECEALRLKVQKLEERILALENSTHSAPDVEIEPMLALVQHLSPTDHQQVIHVLSRAMFNDEELINCSRTGKNTVKCVTQARPPLDPIRLKSLERLVRLKTGISKELFANKFVNVQKVLRRKRNKNEIYVVEVTTEN